MFVRVDARVTITDVELESGNDFEKRPAGR